MAGEIASAYVSLYTKMPGLKSDVSKQLAGVMPAQGKQSGNLFAKGMKLALGGSVMMGAINVAKKGLKSIYDVSVGGGINRAMQIDQARAKLQGLGHSGKEISSIMGSALTSVKGTAFGLGDAATVAATLSASGVSMGNDLTGALKLVADTATISGRSMTDIGAIFSSVAARGKLQGDDMLQLLSSGIPVLQFLAKQTGKTTAEVSDMVSSGQVDFKTFSAAMQKGLGGAAMSSGTTFAGAMANVKAALSRVSANALTVPMDALRRIFVALIPVIDKFGDAFKPMFDAVGARINAAMPGIVAAIGRLPAALTRAQAAIRAKVTSIKQLFSRWDIPLPKIDVQAMFSGAAGAIGVVASAFSLLKGHLGPISGLVAKLTPSLVRLSGSLGGVGGVVRGLTSPLGIVLSLLGAAYASNAQFRDAINGLLPVIVTLVAQVAKALAPAISSIIPVVSQIAATVIPVIAQVGAALAHVVAAIISGLAPVITALVGFIASHMGVVASIAAGIAGVIGAIKAVIGIIGVVTAIVGKVVSVVRVVVNVIKPVHTALFVIRTVFVSLAGPIGIVVVAIGALVAGFTLAYQHSETFRNAVGAVWGGIQAAASAVAGWFTGTLVPTLQSVWNGITAVLSTIGTAISTAFGAVITWFTGVFLPALQVVWTAAVAPARIAIQGLKLAWQSLAAFFTALWASIGAIFSGAMAVIGAAVRAWTSVLRAVFTAAWNVIKITAAAFWLTLRALFTGNFGAIKGIASAALNALKAVFRGAWNAITAATRAFGSSLRAIVSGVVTAVVGFFRRMGSSIHAAASAAFNGARAAASAGMHAMASIVSTVVSAVVGFFRRLGSGIRSAAVSAFNGARSAASAGMHAMGSAVSSGISAVLGFFRSMPGRIRGALGNAGSWLVGTGRSIMDGLGRGITSAAHKVFDTIRNVGSKITDAAKRVLDINSPSRVFRDEVGAQIVAGLVQGIDRNASDAVGSVEAMAAALPPAFATDAAVVPPVPARVKPSRQPNGAPWTAAGGVTVNVNGPTYGDPNDFARRIEQKQREALTMLAYA